MREFVPKTWGLFGLVVDKCTFRRSGVEEDLDPGCVLVRKVVGLYFSSKLKKGENKQPHWLNA
jgi:hypothetical protein